MPMPKPVCRKGMYNKIVLLEVCRTFSGRGMGINGTAHNNDNDNDNNNSHIDGNSNDNYTEFNSSKHKNKIVL